MIITLCGSARFEDAFHYWNERLTLDGHMVYSLSVMPSYKGRKDWYDDETKRKLDDIHKMKINASEAIFVITGRTLSAPGVPPYIGESTLAEISYASARRKHIYTDMEPPKPVRDA